MPRITIDVSDAWLKRLQQVIPAAIDTLTGLEHQCIQSQIEPGLFEGDLIDRLHSQIVDLRRNLEAVRIIF